MPEELRLEAIQAARRLSPYGRSLTEAVNHFISHLVASEKSCTVHSLIEELLDRRRRKSHSYLKDLRARLKRFAITFGDRVAATITTREIDLWINNLNLGSQSHNNFRAVLSTLFSYADSRGYATHNPVAAIEKETVITDPPGIFTPDELTRLLEAAIKVHPEMIPYLAIGAFAGLRVAEIGRLAWDCVDLQGGYIHVSAKASKTAKRRLVKVEPNLDLWLRIMTPSDERVKPTNCQTKLLRIRSAAKLTRWPHNGLRHSYASYHLAKFQDAAALALQMGHKTTDVLFEHYRELVKAKVAEEYWQIVPPPNV